MRQPLPPLTERRVLVPEITAVPARPISARKLSLHGQAFATTWSIEAWVETNTPDLQPACQAWLDLIDTQMSPYRSDSDLTRFNAASDWAFVPLPEVMMKVVHHALAIAELSHGAFDPCLLSAVELWGFGAKAVPDGLPDPGDIIRLRTDPNGWQDLIWQDGGMIKPSGVRLDLCGIAKGFAVDGLCDLLQNQAGVVSALVEVGGELKGFGAQPNGQPWWVEIEASHDHALVALCGQAIATSGDSRRAFSHEGRLYSHTIDATTLAPTQSTVASATVMDAACWRADALATALIVMGEDRALAFASAHAIPCLLRIRDGDRIHERLSPALSEWL